MADKSQRSSDTYTVLRRKKSFQGHQYRRRSRPIAEQYKADLSKVIGLTVTNNCGFACNEATGIIAFPAGCVIIVHQVRKRREFYIFNPGHKSLTCIRISVDGQHIVTGESGHLPCVRVFSVSERCQIASFQSHKFGISCVAFSPNSQYIISMGYQHDNVINVWNWRKNALAASNKVSIKVRAIAFAEDSNNFVTVGNRHIKFWYIENSKVPDTETVPLKGRSGILGSVRGQYFCDVAYGTGSENAFTYAVSRTGILCQFTEKRTVKTFVQLQATTVFCLSVVNGIVVCGCGEGKILILSSVDLSLLNSFLSSDADSGLHDTIAVAMDSKNMWIHCIHADHTIKVWDLINSDCPKQFSSRSFHSECIWDVKVEPCTEEKSGSSFYSCSNDTTVKKWSIQENHCELEQNISINTVGLASTPSNPKSAKAGIRSLCVSVDAKLLAVGDRNGVIHIYHIEKDEHELASKIEMHSGDILSLSYDPSNGMLASASRDRCIYILDSSHMPTYTINDHSAAVTAVEFVYLKNKVRLISCGVDKSLYFCTVDCNDGKVEIVRDKHIVEKHAMHDMTIINDSVVVACGGNLREYDIDSGKSLRCIRGCESSSTIIRVTTDADRTIIAISCSDKFIYILSYLSGDFLLELAGHSELCTSIAFLTSDSEKMLITASADSCLFAWKLTRYSKADDNIVSIHPQLSTHVENDKELDHDVTDSKIVNATTYFGDPEMHGSLIIDDKQQDDLPEEVEKTVENGVDELECTENLKELDTSLPTWLTGNKDKVIKARKPAGKWATRFQDQYNFLDTPRTEMDWEDIDGEDHSTECISEESEGAEDIEDILEESCVEEKANESLNESETMKADSLVEPKPSTLKLSEQAQLSIDVSSPVKDDAKDSSKLQNGVENDNPATNNVKVTDSIQEDSEQWYSTVTNGDNIATDESKVVQDSEDDSNLRSSIELQECDLATKCSNIADSTDDSSLCSSKEMACTDNAIEEKECLKGTDDESLLGSPKDVDQSELCEQGNSTVSTEYVSAQEDNGLSPCTSLATSPKKFKSELSITLPTEKIIQTENSDNVNICDNVPDTDKHHDQVIVKEKPASNARTEETSGQGESNPVDGKQQHDIPPAFADFIQNLTKRKPRGVPSSLPVKSSYNFRNTSRMRSTSETVSMLLTSPRKNSPEKRVQERTVCSPEPARINGQTSSNQCQEVIDNLMFAYEQAESMYHKVSEETRSKDIDASALLQSTFLSLKERIDLLQMNTVKEHDKNNGNWDDMLREYSEKLCCMVAEEIRKKSLVKE